MMNRHPAESLRRVGLVLGLGMLLVLGLLTGLASAQQPDQGSPAPAGVTYWLILNPTQPVNGSLPRLLSTLAELKTAGRIIDYATTPQSSAPGAVPALRVVAAPASTPMLRALRLPGVLDVAMQLPPPPPPADQIGALAVTGVISGLVTDAETDQPITTTDQLAAVELFDAVSYAFLGAIDFTGGSCPDCDGLADSGVYSIEVSAVYTRAKVFADASDLQQWTGTGSPYMDEWYDNQSYFSQAEALSLETPAVANIALDKPGAISGTLRLDAGGLQAHVQVVAYEATSGAEADQTQTGGAGETPPLGEFWMSRLRPGAYKLYFYGGNWPGIVPEWWPDAGTFAHATPVSVTAGITQTVRVTATLDYTRGEQMSLGCLVGNVADEQTGDPIPVVRVSVYEAAGHETAWQNTDSVGHYDLCLDPGDYLVRFWWNRGFVPEYYSNQTSLDTADMVRAAPGRDTYVSADLAPSTALITGSVTYSAGQTIPSGTRIGVWLYPADDQDLSMQVAVLSGTDVYTAPVAPGAYKAQFVPDADSWSTMMLQPPVSQYYQGKYDWGSADVFTVANGEIRQDISGDLPFERPGGCLTGTLTSKAGIPVQGDVFVSLLDVTHLGNPDFFHSGYRSLSEGEFQWCGVEPGQYLVGFSQYPSATTFYTGTTGTGMALGALSANGAVSVTVSVGYTTTNVDGVLDDLGACVSGTVVDRDGRAVPGAGYLVRDAGVVIPIWGGARVGSSAHYGFLQQADEDGTFTICGLAPGSYALEIRGWLPAEGNLSATYPFSVTLGETRELGNVVAVNAQVYIPALSRQ